MKLPPHSGRGWSTSTPSAATRSPAPSAWRCSTSSKKKGLQEHAAVTGRHFLDGLKQLGERHPLIGDVRGHGLFLGVELVRDRRTLEPATWEAEQLVEQLRQRGVLLSTDGPHSNVIKIKPPLPFTKEDADHVVTELDRALTAAG